MVPIPLPDVGAGQETLRVSAWFVEIGDEIQEGDPVVEVLIPGVTIDVVSPVAGRIVRRERMLDESVFPGDVLAWVDPV